MLSVNKILAKLLKKIYLELRSLHQTRIKHSLQQVYLPQILQRLVIWFLRTTVGMLFQMSYCSSRVADGIVRCDQLRGLEL